LVVRTPPAAFSVVVTTRARSPHTWAWAVGHIAEHESDHLGKVTLLKSLLAARPAGRR